MQLMTRIVALACIALLGACASQPLTPIDNLKRYQQQLAAEEQWSLNGKIILRSAEDSEKARVNWQNDSSTDYKIRLSGSLGLGTTYIYGSRHEVRLEQGGEPPLVAATPEQLVYEQLGRNIPISFLRYWVRGIPAPNAASNNIQLNDSGNLGAFSQSGWTLTYSNFKAVDNWNLPGRLDAANGNMQLTVMVSHWQIGPAE